MHLLFLRQEHHKVDVRNVYVWLCESWVTSCIDLPLAGTTEQLLHEDQTGF